MTKHLRYAPVLALALLLAGCEGPCKKITAINGPTLSSGTADFTTFASVGTSVSAGWQSGGLVNRHQTRSAPALFAAQTGHTVLASGTGTYSLPAVDADGIPALLRVTSLSPLHISNAGRVPGTKINDTQATAFHNMAVPYAVLGDFLSAAGYYTTTPERALMFDVVERHQGVVSAQLLSLAPTFISFELGANEVLGAATRGADATAMPYPAATYAAYLTASMNAIHGTVPNAKLALFNVPNVTSIPFFTTLPPYSLDDAHAPITLIGTGGPLGLHDLVLLTADSLLAAGDGFPTTAHSYVSGVQGNGIALPDAVVLTETEQGTITTAVDAMNAAIDSVALRPWIARVDLHGLLADIAVNGYQVGGTHYAKDFLTGGIFSLDGVHPTDLADAVLCNAMIDAVNARFGSTVPRLTVASFATATASSLRPAGLADGPARPWSTLGLAASLPRPFLWPR